MILDLDFGVTNCDGPCSVDPSKGRRLGSQLYRPLKQFS